MDIRTVLFSYLITDVICTGVIGILYWQNRGQFKGLGFWLADFVMQFGGLLLVVMRGVIPDFISMVVGNGLVIGGTILLYTGLERFWDKRGSQLHNVILFALFILVHSYFLLVFPSLTARNINFSLGLLIISLQCAWLLLRRVEVQSRPLACEAGLVFAAYCLVNMVRILIDMAIPTDNDFFNSNLYDTLAVMTYQMLFIALTFSLFLMVNRRLLADLREDMIVRQRAQEAVKFSEEKFQKAFHSSPDSVTITRSRDGQIVEVNEGFIRTTGYSRNEALGSTTVALQLWINLQDRESFIQTLQKEHVVHNAEYDFRAKSGAILNGLLSAEIIQLGNEPHIISVIHDVTERKRTEEALRLEQEFIASALDTQQDTFFLFDFISGKALRWNRAFREISGYSDDEIAALPAPASYYSAEDLARENDVIQRIMQGEPNSVVMDLICKDGRKVTTEYQGAPLKDGNGDYRFIIAIGRDITERRAAEKKLQQAQSQIVEQQRAVAVFEERERLARELHDGIGQTLGYINMETEAARELIHQGEEESVSQMLARLAEAAQGAHDDLRGYIQNLKSEMPPPREDFFSVLERYCRHLREAYLFDVTLVFPQPPPAILASPKTETHLTYIIREALSNARRYSGQRQAAVTIDFNKKTVQAVVEDQGIGMGDNYVGSERRTRERFGLRIMRERVNEMGGSLAIESEAGKGTRVTVRLPRNLSRVALSSLRFLLADDHPLFLDGLRNMLTAHGAQVVGMARDGVEAQEAAQALNPDMILMDIRMPRMNGLEATRQIKATMPGTKIVVLSTSASESDLFEALRAGASGFLLKGMRADAFISALGGLMRGEVEFSAETAQRILSEFPPTDETREQKATSEPATETGLLTKRQMEILRLVANGLTYKEIGVELFLTERTVKYHMGEILARLQLKGRRKAEEYARRKGIK
jgi:PAS domain S-box-containing protein